MVPNEELQISSYLDQTDLTTASAPVIQVTSLKLGVSKEQPAASEPVKPVELEVVGSLDDLTEPVVLLEPEETSELYDESFQEPDSASTVATSAIDTDYL